MQCLLARSLIHWLLPCFQAPAPCPCPTAGKKKLSRQQRLLEAVLFVDTGAAGGAGTQDEVRCEQATACARMLVLQCARLKHAASLAAGWAAGTHYLLWQAACLSAPLSLALMPSLAAV